LIGGFQAGWDEIVGIELESDHVELAKQRIEHWCSSQPVLV